MVAQIRHAMVSLHSHPTDDGIAHFQCSGVLIAPGVVLTVGHVFDDFASERLWVRPQVNRSPAVPIDGDVRRHPTLDAAWFRLGSHPPHAQPLPIDDGNTFRAEAEHALYAYFENALHEALPRRVVAFDAQENRYTTEPLHQSGMSGGALCRDGALWGLLFARYADTSANRGCVLAMHQLWEGFLDRVPGIRRSGAKHAAASPLQSVASHAEEIAELRRVVRALFSEPPLRDWAWPVPLDDGIPRRLDDVLNTDDRDRGEQVVNWVVAVTDAINTDVRFQRLSLVPPAQERIRDGLLQAMGKATRLCLDPEQLASLGRLRQRLEVTAATPEGALIAVRNKPHQGWQAVRRDGDAPAFTDRFTCSLIESGVGDDANYGILSAIASLRSRENPTGASIVVNPANSARWRQFLTDERSRGRGRCLVVGHAYRDALGPDIDTWLDRFGVRVVVLLGGGDSLFWFEEDLLLGRVQGFLHSFEAFAHWKTANDS